MYLILKTYLPWKVLLGLCSVTAVVGTASVIGSFRMMNWIQLDSLPAIETQGTSVEEKLKISQIEFEEVFVNIQSSEVTETHFLRFKVQFDLFGNDARALMEQRRSTIKDTLIETARIQTLENLRTLTGKLYFKESLVSAINAHLNQAIVKEVHFSSFYLQ